MKCFASFCSAWFLASLLSPLTTLAQLPGQMDITFKSGLGTNSTVRATARQKDGKLIIAGDFTTVQGYKRNRIARLLPNGAVDTTFNPRDGANGAVRAVIIRPDGKIFIGGEMDTYNGATVDRIALLNPDGTRDPSFNLPDGANDAVSSLALQSDGKLLVAGSFTTLGSSAVQGLGRLTATGAVDTTFNAASNNTVNTVVLQPDGNILVAGQFSNIGGAPVQYLARLSTTGVLDATFKTNGGTGPAGDLTAIALQSDGKILIGGYFLTFNATPRQRLARLNADGSLDSTFTASGVTQPPQAIIPLADGKVYVVGSSGVARFAKDGSADSSYPTVIIPGSGSGAVLQPDGKLFVAGGFISVRVGSVTTPAVNMARLLSTGQVDKSFTTQSGVDGVAGVSAIQPDGKYLLTGELMGYNGLLRPAIFRLNTNGTVDPSFDPGQGPSNIINDIAVLTDGSVIVAGNFTTFNGTNRGRIAKLTSKGQLVTGFGTGVGANDEIYAIYATEDGKLLIAGDFTSYNGTPISRVARLNADGSLDGTFTVGTGANGTVHDITVEMSTADRPIIIVGEFTSYDGTGRNRIARLTNTGSLDTSFNPNNGFNNTARRVIVTVDRSYIVTGLFTAFNGTLVDGFASLQSNGPLSPNFQPQINGSVVVARELMGSELLIAGSFTHLDGQPCPKLALIDARTGQRSTRFHPGDSVGAGQIYDLQIQKDGRALVLGDFRSYDGVTAHGVARVHTALQLGKTAFNGITSPLQANDTALAGAITLTGSSNNGFSGSLTLGLEKVPFKGAFNAIGTTQLNTAKKDKSALQLSLTLVRGARGLPELGGIVFDYAGRQSLINGQMAYFPAAKEKAVQFAGNHNVSLRGTGPSVGALPVSGQPYLQAKITTAGTVALTGKTADGQIMTSSVSLNQNGQVLLYYPLYKGPGFVVGNVDFYTGTALPVPKAVGGVLYWYRPTGALPGYTTSFLEEMFAEGFQYVPLAKTLPPFGGVDPASVQVRISGGNVAAPIIGLGKFQPNGQFVYQTGGGFTTLVLNFNPATGLVTGTCSFGGHTKPIALQAVSISRSQGKGSLMVPNSPGSSSFLPSLVELTVLVP